MERLLRKYEHVAQKEHWCDRCCTHIEPGERYEGSVYVSRNDVFYSGLYTFKAHIDPECDFPEDPDDDDEADNDEDIDGLEHAVHNEQTANETRKAA